MSWKNDSRLEDQLRKYVAQNLKRAEVYDFILRDFSYHFMSGTFSMRTLDRMLEHFEIKYIDYNVDASDLKKVVEKELNDTGRKLGYRALTGKIRQEYGLNVPRDIVYATMTQVDDSGLKDRQPAFKKKKKKGHFTTRGVNWFLSIDGHDKLMGYQNSTFPIAIYGLMDQASRKMLMLKCWTGNSNPRLIGKWYIDYLMQTRILAANVRLDRGTETGKLASIHAFLRSKVGDLNDPLDCVVYGPSTSNQIERWWRDLHWRLEKHFKEGLNALLSLNQYNPHNNKDRNMLSFIMIPVVQRELDVFCKTIWNSHRIRQQKGTALPNGIPDHIYNFPERYGLQECGFQLEKKDVIEAAELSDVNDVDEDFLLPDFRRRCEELIPLPGDIPSNKFTTAFKYLKDNF